MRRVEMTLTTITGKVLQRRFVDRKKNFNRQRSQAPKAKPNL